MRRTVLFGLMGVLCLGLWTSAAPALASEAGERELEATLIHRQLVLKSVQSYSRARKVWQPLREQGARVRVVNLWAKPCLPCLAELPELRALAAEWKQRSSRAVQFLFIADPPDQTPPEEVVRFWASPYADGLARSCPQVEDVKSVAHNGVPSCLLTVPDEDPARSAADDLLRSLKGTEVRPLTLLLDEQGIIRQVFAGSIKGKRVQVSEAIERLLQVAGGPKRTLAGR